MTPRMDIMRRASLALDSEPLKYAIFRLDGVDFCSDIPRGQADVVEINSAIERLADFVNSVSLSP